MAQDAGEQDSSRAQNVAAWMDVYGPLLKRYFRRRVSAAEADDLVQDVFLAMQAHRGDAPIENVQGYLFTIASRLLAKRKSALSTLTLEEVGSLSDGFSPEHLVISRQEFVLVVAAIRRVPPRAREAFILHRFEDMTYAAIGRKLDISVSAVGKLIARALSQITRELKARP